LGPVGLWLEQDAAVLAGPDSILRADAFALGGPGTLRGSFEGAYRAIRYFVQRVEVGPRPRAPDAARVYALFDVGWWRQWQAQPDGPYGRAAGNRLRWAAGVGFEVPSRAGNLRLDYAVPDGAPLTRGRIHFGVVSRF
jgi:hypothetical protein